MYYILKNNKVYYLPNVPHMPNACPVCYSIGFHSTLNKGVSSCALCGVNISWDRYPSKVKILSNTMGSSDYDKYIDTEHNVLAVVQDDDTIFYVLDIKDMYDSNYTQWLSYEVLVLEWFDF